MLTMLWCSPIFRDKGSLSENNVGGRIMLEKNGKTTNSFFGDVTAERITALQVFYSSAFSLRNIPLIQYESGNISIFIC